mmetsp:Transcript_21707/g.26726  ORF Transcript_21707/g.26726 Transcript_21707/m.26726 type:complete len:254 (+) Transcript_21707:2162-2923(+)
MDAVKGLLSGFSLPRARQELRHDILDGLLAHLLLTLQFLAKNHLLFTKGHIRLSVQSLTEGCRHVGVVGVRILPKLASEALAFFPVGDQMCSEELLADFPRDGRVRQLEEVTQHDLVLLILRALVDLFHRINKSLEFVLAQRLLLHERTICVARNGAISEPDFFVEVSKELLVTLADLVVLVCEVEGEGVAINARHILKIVGRFCDVVHRLILQVHLDDRHGPWVLLLAHAFNFRHSGLHLFGHFDLASIVLQ